MKTILFIALSSIPALLHAHPGHGSSDGISLWHYLTSAPHALSLVGVGLLMYFGLRAHRILKSKI